jgi:predicted Zn-dependent protease
MEPQATFGLIEPIFRWPYPYLELEPNQGAGAPWPFHDEGTLKTYTVSPWGPPAFVGGTRIGERVLDERITLSFDPLDPDLGVVPFADAGEPVVPVTWVKDGVLTALAYDRVYALQTLHEPLGKPNSGAFKMSGGTTTIDEMIATTKRGLIVTRFWGTSMVDPFSILITGVTRDGLWLIENGKISHPVKNLRFTESPLFAFNQVDQLGVPVPIFSPGLPAVVPSVKVRDFSFTALVDAI